LILAKGLSMSRKLLNGSGVLALGLVIAAGLGNDSRAQQPLAAPAAPPAVPAQTAPISSTPNAGAGEPMVAPIQRVKPVAPKLDPRLSAAPVAKAGAKPAALKKTAAKAKVPVGKKTPALASKAAPKGVDPGTTASTAPPKTAPQATVPPKKPVTAAGEKPAAGVTTR
jgi:hypothetical protein